ncbi:Proteasome subunit alpha type-2 [Diplonema papillatum]|nr:Proteasome subunit alpha type-2 [Diplonema papillatum]
MGDSAYAFSLTTFSPQGKLIQIDYAMSRVSKGGTALGIKASDGICIAVEKKNLPLQDVTSVARVLPLDEHVGVTYSGMIADAKIIFAKAMQFCQVYRREYNIPIPVRQLVRRLADVMQEYTQSNGVRPFGCSLLVAGADDTGDHLYQVDPSGLFICWKATAIGRGSGNAKTNLEKRYSADLELGDAVNISIRTLKEGFDGKMTNETIEIGRVQDGKFSVLTMDEVEEHLQELD